MIGPPPLLRAERVIWIVAVAVIAFGYAFITAKYERQITASSLRSEDYYRRILTNQRLVANSFRVRALRTELKKRLGGVLVDTPMDETLAVLINDVDIRARADHATLISIVPERVAAEPQTGGTLMKRTASGMQDSAVDIMVRGRFPDILHLIAHLPRLHTLMRVSDVQFTVAGGQKAAVAKPLLDAKIRTLLYRYIGNAMKGDS